jgi:hypothetical protein
MHDKKKTKKKKEKNEREDSYNSAIRVGSEPRVPDAGRLLT